MDLDILRFLAAPFAASLILTGIHSYLGVHVVERGVIFVDLSLAQIAALGTTMAYLAGHDLHDPVTYYWSLGFTIIGAATFAFTRVHRETRIPQTGHRGRYQSADAVLRRGTPKRQNLRRGHRTDRGRRAGQPAVLISQYSRAKRRRTECGICAHGSGTRFTAFLLLMEYRAG